MQTMKRAVFFFLSAARFALCARAEVLPSKVYVVANSDDPDSLAIADFYASARGIPKGNIVGLPMPKAGKISRAEYFEKIENPLVAELAKRPRNLFVCITRHRVSRALQGSSVGNKSDPRLARSKSPKVV